MLFSRLKTQKSLRPVNDCECYSAPKLRENPCQEVSWSRGSSLAIGPRAVMSQSRANISGRPPTRRTDRLRLALSGGAGLRRGRHTKHHVQRTGLAAEHLPGEVRDALFWHLLLREKARRSDRLTLAPPPPPSLCRAKELKALFGSLLQKSDLNGQAKKNEKLK